MQPNIYISSSDFDNLFNIRDSVMDKKMDDYAFVQKESSPKSFNYDNQDTTDDFLQTYDRESMVLTYIIILVPRGEYKNLKEEYQRRKEAEEKFKDDINELLCENMKLQKEKEQLMMKLQQQSNLSSVNDFQEQIKYLSDQNKKLQSQNKELQSRTQQYRQDFQNQSEELLEKKLKLKDMELKMGQVQHEFKKKIYQLEKENGQLKEKINKQNVTKEKDQFEEKKNTNSFTIGADNSTYLIHSKSNIVYGTNGIQGIYLFQLNFRQKKIQLKSHQSTKSTKIDNQDTYT